MSLIFKNNHQEKFNLSQSQANTIAAMIANAASIIAPVWPLKTFIACNPLQGFENLAFEDALVKAEHYQEINRISDPDREVVNREMIKWLTAFLDEGQATIRMPSLKRNFYQTFADLAKFDSHLHKTYEIIHWLNHLPKLPEQAIAESFNRLNIAPSAREEFMRQSLWALPGWSGYVKWNTDWRNVDDKDKPINMIEYVAVRLILTCVLWPNAHVLKPKTITHSKLMITPLAEENYRNTLLQKLLPEASALGLNKIEKPDAQLVFCIDVRSEPFRRNLEAIGKYQTFGFAGFFGLPVRIKKYDHDEAYDSCPVLLKPCHEVCEQPSEHLGHTALLRQHRKSLLQLPKSFYQALKYNFATSFALVEILGPWLGIRMLARTFMPSVTAKIKMKMTKIIMPPIKVSPLLDSISLTQQADYAETALRMMGLSADIAPIVVFCGHGSSTNNNAYASALDCGACGGNHGDANAAILAAILNNDQVRSILLQRGLLIPEHTLFIAAEHNTTTDHLQLYCSEHLNKQHQQIIDQLKLDLLQARKANTASRCLSFGINKTLSPIKATWKRSQDWAQPRPEWGLAGNAAFIVGPRALTQHVNLEGRCFLHSYDWRSDHDGKFLQTILTAPMVVAQWINSQYLFSSLDNVNYGSGSKITKNITGKIGIMQGNASDLMHGLPLQSVYALDHQPYHSALRLLTVVYAPREMISQLIQANSILQKLFGNGWVVLSCIEPSENKSYLLQRDMTWQIIH